MDAGDAGCRSFGVRSLACGESMTIEPLKQFFSRLTERSFADLFIRDRTIAEYVAGALTYMRRVYFLPEVHRGRYSDVVQRLIVW